MEKGRIFVIGDIHGCLDMLDTMMHLIDWRPERDRLIFLGDYIDRGRDPKGVIDYILELKKQSNLVECLRGNHEELFLDFLEGKEIDTFLYNGGESTLASYGNGGRTAIPPEHMDFFNSLKTLIELDEYYIVHAGFRPGVDISMQSQNDLLWIRDPFIFSEYNFRKKVIFGHTPFSSPFTMYNKIGIDTGAVFGNRLTCLELSSMRFYSVQA